MRPGVSTPFGSKLSRTRLVNAATAGASVVNTATAARTAAGARMSVAWPPASTTAARTSGAWASDAGGSAAQTSPPA